MKTFEIGFGKVKIGMVGSIHGNELVGMRVIESLRKNPPTGAAIKMIVANEPAIRKNIRFIDIDGNRCFPGKINGNNEERLAVELLRYISDCDYLIDIHSTYAKQPDTIIITRKNVIKFAKYVPIRKILLMGNGIAKGHSLIDHTRCGLSIEFNRIKSTIHVDRIIRSTIANMLKGKSTGEKEIYKVTRSVPKLGKSVNLKNFRLVKRGEVIQVKNKSRIRSRNNFYPVFFGEKMYHSLCMEAKKVRL